MKKCIFTVFSVILALCLIAGAPVSVVSAATQQEFTDENYASSAEHFCDEDCDHDHSADLNEASDTETGQTENLSVPYRPDKESVESVGSNSWVDVKTDNAPVRSTYYSSGSITKRLARGSIILVTGSVKNTKGNLWYKTNGGYIYSGNVQSHSWHRYTYSVTKNPTCKAEGQKKGTCVCGKAVYESIAKVGHSYGSNFFCVYNCGSYTGVSTVYSGITFLYVKENGAIAHSGPYGACRDTATYKKGVILTATATVRNGYQNTWYRLLNGNYIHDKYVVPHNSHTWNGGKVTKEATCKAEGKKVYTCTLCGETKTESIPKAHKYNAKTFMCVFGCGSYNPNSVSVTSFASNTLYVKKSGAPVHNGPYGECKTVAKLNKGKIVKSVATLKNGYGKIWYRLSDGTYLHADYATVHNTHTWNGGKITKDATCKAEGKKVYTCTLCGATKTEAVPKAHKYDSKTFMCVYNCGKYNPKSVTTVSTASNTLCVISDKALAHNGPYGACASVAKYKKGQILKSAATLKNGYGNIWYKISDGTYINVDYVKVHNSCTWDKGKITKAPTCKATGVKTFTCTMCGKTKTESVAKCGHKYDAKTHMCVYNCGNYDPKSVTVKSASANTLYVKSNNAPAHNGPYGDCKTVKKYSKGKILKSAATVKNGFGNTWYKLSDGTYLHADYVTFHNTHTWNSGKITKAPTCKATGVRTYTCTLCGATKTGSVSKTGHKYDSKTHMCAFGCGYYDPKSVTVKSAASNDLYVTKNSTPTHSGPYGDCKTVSTYNKGKTLKSVATVKNGFGNIWYKLSDGTFVYTDYVSVHNTHKWNGGKITKAATCKATGVKTYTCQICGKTKTESVAKTGHKYDSKTFMCTYGCGNYNPKSVTVKESKSITLYAKADCISRKGPYDKTAKVSSFKKYAVLNVKSTVNNGFGNIWYKLSDGSYIYSGNTGVPSLKMNKKDVSMYVGIPQKLSVIVEPLGAKVTWASSDTSIATVDGSGKVIFRKAAATNISAILKFGSVTHVVYFSVTGKWLNYNVKYNANVPFGTSYSKTSAYVDKQSCKYARSYTAAQAAFARTGYTLIGWSKTNKGGVNFNLGQAFSNLTSKDGDTVTLYAVWRQNNLKVFYNANGGTVSNKTLNGKMHYNKLASDNIIIHTTNASDNTKFGQKFTYDTAKDLYNATTFGLTRAGYTFVNWNTAKNGSGTTYDQNTDYRPTKLSGKIKNGDANLVLYAMWKPIQYTVTFNGNGATSGETKTQTFTYDKSQKLTKNNFALKNYKFLGWSYQKDGAIAFKDGQSVSNLRATAGKVNLYAVWGYTITYNSNGGTGGATGATIAPKGQNVTLASCGFTRPLYYCKEWNTKPDGTGTPYLPGATVGALKQSNGKATLYAIWDSKMWEFVNTPVWADGASWGGRRPEKSPFDGQSCCAYCADFAWFVFGKNSPRDGEWFNNANEIRSGDVIIIGDGGDGTGHWFVVLERDGNRLHVAEGNFSGRVRIGWNYTIEGNGFGNDVRAFTEGYHFQ